MTDPERAPLLGSRGREKKHGDDSDVKHNVKIGPQLMASLVAGLGFYVSGFTSGFSSIVVPQLQTEVGLDTVGISWFTSLLPLGAMFTAPIGSLLNHWLGHKAGIIIACVPFTMGYVCIAMSGIPAVLYTGRLLTGMAEGIIEVSATMYIAEVTSVHLRGIFNVVLDSVFNFGIISGLVIGIFLHYKWLAIVGASLCTLTAFLMCFMPPTPRYLIQNCQPIKAKQSLQWLRGKNSDIQEEFDQIEENFIISNLHTFNWRELADAKYYYPILLGVSLLVFQKCMGINVIDYYSVSIFQAAGFGQSATLPPVLVAFVGLIGNFPAYFLIERMGRKTLLIMSSVGVSLSCYSLGTFYFLFETKNIDNISWLSVVSVVTYMFTYSLGWGPVVWELTGELFPLKVRSFAFGCTTVVGWLLVFFVSKEFPILVEATSNYVGFWIFAGVATASIFYIIFVIPETKGKSLEEIEQYFRNRSMEGKVSHSWAIHGSKYMNKSHPFLLCDADKLSKI